MGNQVRRVLLMMVLIAVLVLPVSAYAQQMPEIYEINHSDESKPYQYGSRCQCAFSVWDEAGEKVIWTGWNAPEVWNLVGAGSEEPGIPAYSLTAEPVAEMDAVCGYTVKPLSCEDSEKLQAIVLHSFPYLSLEELEKRVNDVRGEGSIVNLTEGEAISAAQQAIWKVWYADRFESEKLYVSIRGISQYRMSRFLYPGSLEDTTEQDTTKSNIRNLYQYYLGICGTDFKTEEELAFADVKYESVRMEDGSTSVTVSFRIAGIPETEDLYLTVSGEGFLRREPVREGEVTLSFTGLEKEERILLMLDGTQTRMRAFQFVSEQNAPVLIGCRMQKHRVFAQLQVGPEEEDDHSRIVVIHMDRIVPVSEFSGLPVILMGIGIVLICAGLAVAICCMRKDGDR